MGARKAMKKGARRGGKKAAGQRRDIRNVSEYASLSEYLALTPSSPGGFQTNTMYSLMNTSLSLFTRALNPARAYQHYRIKYIQLKIKPHFDTYLVNPANPVGKPHLYYMIDKSGSIPTNITLAGLKQMGAKPRALDEKPLPIGWRPSVLEQTLTVGGAAPQAQGARYVISPWLNTNANSVDIAAWNPSTVDHLGVYWYVEQPVGTAQPYDVEVEVQLEFKKPASAGAVGQFNAQAVVVKLTNTSRDGYVDDRSGGDDLELVARPS